MKRKFTEFSRLNYSGFARVTNKQGAKGWLYKDIHVDAETLKELQYAKNVTFATCVSGYAPELLRKSVILWDKCI